MIFKPVIVPGVTLVQTSLLLADSSPLVVIQVATALQEPALKFDTVAVTDAAGTTNVTVALVLPTANTVLVPGVK